MEFGPFAVAIAFWVFVAIATVAGIVGDYKKRQLTLEPLRAAIERTAARSAVVERLMAPNEEPGIKPIGLRISGIITSQPASAWHPCLLPGPDAPVALPVLGGVVAKSAVGLGLVIASTRWSAPPSAKVRGPAV
jgi:hypothetical protein